MFGGGFGGFSSGGRPSMGAAGRNDNGLPFAGIPEDLAEGVAKLEAIEPDHGDPHEPFDPVADNREPSRHCAVHHSRLRLERMNHTHSRIINPQRSALTF